MFSVSALSKRKSAPLPKSMFHEGVCTMLKEYDKINGIVDNDVFKHREVVNHSTHTLESQPQKLPKNENSLKKSYKDSGEHHVVKPAPFSNANGKFKPYNCVYCGKGFIYAMDLKRHKAIHVTKTTSTQVSGRRYTCQQCNKAFALRTMFIIHQKRHLQKCQVNIEPLRGVLNDLGVQG